MSRSMRVRSSDGLIEFLVDEDDLARIQKDLGNLKVDSRKLIKTAVNKTAKQAKERLAQKAQETYVVKKTRFTKAMDTKNATVGNLEAVINVTGAQLELKDFKVSPASYRPKNPPSIVKAKVLLSSGLKPLATSNAKAFIAQFKSGHTSVVQRKGTSRLPVKKLMSNSVPKMIGSQQRVYGIIAPHIHDDLMANIQAEIRKVLSS